MNLKKFLFISVLLVLAFSLATSLASASDIVYDSEFQVLVTQHGEKWEQQDKEIDKRLQALEKKFGK